MANTTYTSESQKLSDTLKRQGLDYSAEDVQKMGDVFNSAYQQQATDAYKKAQNDYYNNMRSAQNTLADTMRRNNAQAVATGASRGLNAANELSAMLGLTQEAAAGSKQLGSDYGAQLSDARVKADELASQLMQSSQQNASNVLGQEVAADAQRDAAQLEADIATGAEANRQAQGYLQAGDYANAERAFAQSLQGNPTYVNDDGTLTEAGKAYVESQMASGLGMSVDDYRRGFAHTTSGTRPDGSKGSVNAGGVGTADSPSVGTYDDNIKFNNDQGIGVAGHGGTGNNFSIKVNGKTLRVEYGAEVENQSIKNAMAANGVKLGQNQVFVYEGRAYVSNKDGKVFEIRARGDGSYSSDIGVLNDYLRGKYGTPGDSTSHNIMNIIEGLNSKKYQENPEAFVNDMLSWLGKTEEDLTDEEKKQLEDFRKNHTYKK